MLPLLPISTSASPSFIVASVRAANWSFYIGFRAAPRTIYSRGAEAGLFCSCDDDFITAKLLETHAQKQSFYSTAARCHFKLTDLLASVVAYFGGRLEDILQHQHGCSPAPGLRKALLEALSSEAPVVVRSGSSCILVAILNSLWRSPRSPQ